MDRGAAPKVQNVNPMHDISIVSILPIRRELVLMLREASKIRTVSKETPRQQVENAIANIYRLRIALENGTTFVVTALRTLLRDDGSDEEKKTLRIVETFEAENVPLLRYAKKEQKRLSNMVMSRRQVYAEWLRKNRDRLTGGSLLMLFGGGLLEVYEYHVHNLLTFVISVAELASGACAFLWPPIQKFFLGKRDKGVMDRLNIWADNPHIMDMDPLRFLDAKEHNPKGQASEDSTST